MKKYLILFLIILFPSLFYIFLTKGKHNFIHLPKFGEREAITRIIDGKEVTDTLYHTVQDFTLTNQYGEQFGLKDLDNKVIIAEFFFSTCKSICPIMNKNMARVYEKIKKDSNIVILSFTVDPATDTAEALLAYSQQFSPEKGKWYFLTGSKEVIYTLALKSFLLNALDKGDSIPDFIHDEHFVLVDKERHIRGMYLGTDTKDVDRLIDEIKVLKAQEFVPKRKH